MVYAWPIKVVLWLVKMTAEAMFIPIRVFRLFKRPKKCPPIKDDILLWSAEKLAERIRKKKITSLVVVKTYISRINEVNPLLNAIIENRFPDAIDDAKKVDEFLQHTKLTEDEIKEKHPLLGVPVTIKGSLAVTGMLYSAGSLDHIVRAETDATAVKYIKDAGAIPLLISNVPELCFSWETVNKLVGTTSNPYDNTRSCGGSSGGEASLIGSGASVIGLGSDLAGSLRQPAHYCGIWGHKPSPQVVPSSGHYPVPKNPDENRKFFTVGPMARYASDLRLVLNLIAEPSQRDLLKLNEKVDVKKIKVYYMKNYHPLLSEPASEEVYGAVQKVVKHLNTVCDNKCREVDLSCLRYSGEMCYLRLMIMRMDIENFYNGEDAKVYFEFLNYLMGKSNRTLTVLSFGIIKYIVMNFLPKDTVNTMFAYFEKLRERLLKLLGDDGVLIIPTSPTEAIYHNDVFRRAYGDFGYCSVFNIIGFPSTNCPVGFTKNGLPLGLQVVAAPNLDRLTLSVAEDLERRFGGWKF